MCSRPYTELQTDDCHLLSLSAAGVHGSVHVWKVLNTALQRYSPLSSLRSGGRMVVGGSRHALPLDRGLARLNSVDSA